MSQCMCRVQTTTFKSELSSTMWVPESEPRLSGLGASIFTWYAISITQGIYCLITQHDGDNANGAEETKHHRPSHPRYQKLGKDWFSIWNSAWCTRKLLSSWMREWTLRGIASVFTASLSAWPTLPKVKLSMHDLKWHCGLPPRSCGIKRNSDANWSRHHETSPVRIWRMASSSAAGTDLQASCGHQTWESPAFRI